MRAAYRQACSGADNACPGASPARRDNAAAPVSDTVRAGYLLQAHGAPARFDGFRRLPGSRYCRAEQRRYRFARRYAAQPAATTYATLWTQGTNA